MPPSTLQWRGCCGSSLSALPPQRHLPGGTDSRFSPRPWIRNRLVHDLVGDPLGFWVAPTALVIDFPQVPPVRASLKPVPAYSSSDSDDEEDAVSTEYRPSDRWISSTSTLYSAGPLWFPETTFHSRQTWCLPDLRLLPKVSRVEFML